MPSTRRRRFPTLAALHTASSSGSTPYPAGNRDSEGGQGGGQVVYTIHETRWGQRPRRRIPAPDLSRPPALHLRHHTAPRTVARRTSARPADHAEESAAGTAAAQHVYCTQNGSHAQRRGPAVSPSRACPGRTPPGISGTCQPASDGLVAAPRQPAWHGTGRAAHSGRVDGSTPTVSAGRRWRGTAACLLCAACRGGMRPCQAVWCSSRPAPTAGCRVSTLHHAGRACRCVAQ